MWAAAVVRQAEGMEHVEGKERERMKREMGAFLDVLSAKPWTGMRKMREHRAGGLRLWPKWKSLKKVWYGKSGRKQRTRWAEDAAEAGRAISEEIEEVKSRREAAEKRKAGRRKAEEFRDRECGE